MSKLSPRYRVRRIDQYVIPLPTNGETARSLMTRLAASYPDVPLRLIKIKVDEASQEILVSVPVDWLQWAHDEDAYGVDEERI